MAQVAQLQKQTEETRSLNKVASKHFVKRMLAIGISNILYLRNIFPESAFADRKIEDLPLKILKEQGHEGAARIVQWMKGVYDALDKEYLRALIFAVVRDKQNPESVMESYTFCFTYENGSVQASLSASGDSTAKTTVPTKAETSESARKFLRNLMMITTTMDNLPPNVFITVRLLYYDNKTPTEYQPPGFIEAVEKDTLGFVIDNLRIKLGHIITPHTCMKVRVRAPKSQFEAPEKPMKPEFEIDDSQITIDSSGDFKAPNPRQMDISNEMEAQDDRKKTAAEFEEVSKEEVETDLGVRCPCMDPDDDGVMILCSICNHWQHAICFCLYDETSIPENHICHLCSDKHTSICTDPRLNGLQKEQQLEMCAWRRVLQCCLDKESISLAVIATQLSSTRNLAQKMMSRLIEEKILAKGSSKQTKRINHEQLKAVFQRDIAHVCDNLMLQRKDHEESMNLDDESSVLSTPPQIEKRKAAPTNAMPASDHDEKRAMKRRPSARSPINSQSSAYVFRADSEQQGANSRKRRRIAKTEVLPGRR